MPKPTPMPPVEDPRDPIDWPHFLRRAVLPVIVFVAAIAFLLVRR